MRFVETVAYKNIICKKNMIRMIYFNIIDFFFITFFYMLFTGTVPSELRDALMILVGTSGSGYTAVLGYWLGSSSSSSNKDALIARLKT